MTWRFVRYHVLAGGVWRDVVGWRCVVDIARDHRVRTALRHLARRAARRARRAVRS